MDSLPLSHLGSPREPLDDSSGQAKLRVRPSLYGRSAPWLSLLMQERKRRSRTLVWSGCFAVLMSLRKGNGKLDLLNSWLKRTRLLLRKTS